MKKYIFSLLFLVTLIASSTQAAYIQLYSSFANGGISFTGNTLGLSKREGFNQPGILGSIGAFITTDSSQQVGLFPAGNPGGTTINYLANSSTAVLDLPPGSTVLYAELVWSGSYQSIDILAINQPVQLTTPSGNTQSITPRSDTAQTILPLPGDTEVGFYTRTADVTALVTEAGEYAVGSVFGTVLPLEDNNNFAGWTLAVAFENPNMSISNLTLFAAAELSNEPAAEITNFQAPNSPLSTSRLFISATDGDVDKEGDQLRVGSNPVLGDLSDSVSGSNNPVNNFFCSQINTLLTYTTIPLTGKITATGSSVLDTRGTYGSRNGDAATSTATLAQRQGYDITSIDISSKVLPGQQALYVKGVSGVEENFVINALGLQIEVEAPNIAAVKSADKMVVDSLGDIITYSVSFKNNSIASTANSAVFTDQLPTGLSFVPNSLTINNASSGGDISTGVNVGNIVPGGVVNVVFQAEVTAIYPPITYENFALLDFEFTPTGSSTPFTFSARTNLVTISAADVPLPVAQNDSYSTNANTTLDGPSVLANDSGVDITVTSYSNTTVAGSSVVVNPNGTFTYIPATGFSGTDQFNYTITDIASQQASATVTITVLPVAQADSGTTSVNMQLSPSTSVLDNDIGTGLSVSGYDLNTIAGGTVSMDTAGFYTYQPPASFSGMDQFNYTIVDQIGNFATTSVMLNVLPIANNDSGTTSANTTLNGPSVLNNDLGTNLSIFSFNSISLNNGSVQMATDGTYSYTPPAGFSGFDSFNYTAQDGSGLQSSATVFVDVTPVANNDTGQTNANTILNGASVLANDFGTNLAVVSFTNITAAGATVQVSSNGTYVYTPPLNFSGSDSFNYTLEDGVGQQSSATVTISILPVANNDFGETVANVSFDGNSVFSNDIGTGISLYSYDENSQAGGEVFVRSDGTYNYAPPLNFSGSDQFGYTIIDQSGQQSSGVVFINVLPIARDNTGATQANTPFEGESVFLNDTGTNLSIYSFSQGVNGGIVNMNDDGTYLYIPPLNYSGPDGFSYTLTDSAGNQATAIVSMTVDPLAFNYTETTAVNTPLTGRSVLTLSAGTNLSVDSFAATSANNGTVTLNTATGQYVYTPSLNFVGEDTVIDSFGNRASGKVTIDVQDESQSPIYRPMPPENFIGRVKSIHFLNQTDRQISLTWKKSPSRGVKNYRIYYENELVNQVSANSVFEYLTDLNSKRDAYKYEISAVGKYNIESSRQRVRVVYE